MTRRILCKKCGGGWALHPEDLAMGIHARRLLLEIGPVPAHHGIMVISETPTGLAFKVHEAMSSIRCDLCGDPIGQGNSAWAITTWNTNREPEPRTWETEYGEVKA